MLAQRPVKLFLLIVLIVGFYPVIGWAGGPKLLTDVDMDGIYAKGIWVNFEINIALPGGNSLSVPSITIPDISMPGKVGGASGGIASVNVPKQSVNTATANTAQASSGQPTTGQPTTGQNSPSVNTPTAGTGQSSPAVVSGANTSSPVSAVTPVYQSSYPGAGIQISDSAMQGNSGMIINAPNSAVSMSISVVVLNNSTVTGDILQSTNSYPTNLFLSLKSYMQ
jgi:hypothetical protein